MISTKATACLILLLFIPFVLTTFGFEPYPAVILPSGAGNIRKQGQQIDIPYKKMYALNAHNQWREIDAVRFTYPMPIQYYPLLLDVNLGFSDVKLSWREQWVFKKLGIRRKQHEIGTADVIAYLQKKLTQQNLSNEKIKIVEYVKTIDLESNTPLSIKISNEKIIPLR